MVVPPVEERDLHVGGAESSGGGEAPETAPDDEDMWNRRQAVLDELLIGSV